MYKFDVLAVDNGGNSSYSVVESQYRYPTPKYFKWLLKLGRGGYVVNFTLHKSNEEYENELWEMIERGCEASACTVKTTTKGAATA